MGGSSLTLPLHYSTVAVVQNVMADQSPRQRAGLRDSFLSHQKGKNNGLLTNCPELFKNIKLDAALNAECVTVDKVSDQYREPFILTGYRQPNSPFLYCIVSAFRLNNETLNIWTHFIPIVAFTVYFWATFPSPLWPLAAIKPLYHPLMAEQLSILAYHFCSTVAHTFNCMSPRVRHICFYLDYAAISMYATGIGCSTAHYSWPINSELFLFEHPAHYIRFCSLLCVVVMYIMCASRHKWAKVKYIIRTLAYMSLFIYTNSPTFYRFWRCLLKGEHNLQSLPYLLIGWSAYVVAAVLNPSRWPERCFPTTFDIVGHNHQLVHILVTLASLMHLWAVRTDIAERLRLGILFEERIALNSSSLEWMFSTLIVTLVVALWFGRRLLSSGHLKN